MEPAGVWQGYDDWGGRLLWTSELELRQKRGRLGWHHRRDFATWKSLRSKRRILSWARRGGDGRRNRAKRSIVGNRNRSGDHDSRPRFDGRLDTIEVQDESELRTKF